MTAVKKFFGYRMIAIAAVMEFMSAGFFFYSFAVFSPLIGEDLNIPVEYLGIGMSLFIATNSLTSLISGRLLDRYPINYIMGAGVFLFAFTLLWVSLTTSVLSLAFAMVVSGFSCSFFGMLAPARLMANWFNIQRGLANGLCNLGVSGSGVIIPPLAGLLIVLIGWQHTLQSYFAFALLIGAPLAFFFVVSRPADVGQYQDNLAPSKAQAEETSKTTSTEKALRTKQILTNRNFWYMAVYFSAMFTCIPTTFSFIGPYFNSVETSIDASWLLSITALMAMLGKVTFGYLADRVKTIYPLLGIPIFTLLGFVLFSLSDTIGLSVFAPMAFGFGFGGIITMNNYLYAKVFNESMANAMGLGRVTSFPFQMFAPIVAGIGIATLGSYQTVFLALTVLPICSMVAAALIHLELAKTINPAQS